MKKYSLNILQCWAVFMGRFTTSSSANLFSDVVFFDSCDSLQLNERIQLVYFLKKDFALNFLSLIERFRMKSDSHITLSGEDETIVMFN